MRLTAELQYPADPAAVYAMFLDRDFQVRKATAAGAESAGVTIEPRGAAGAGGAVIVSHWLLGTDGMPGTFRSLVGSTLRLDRTEDWGPAGPDGSRQGRITLRTPQGPVHLTGTLRLEQTPSGSRQLVDADLRAKVPLLGGQIEKAAHPVLLAAIDTEGVVARDWLAGR